MKTAFLLVSFIFTSQLIAQVGIGTTIPNSSSALDVNSTTRGMLPPRMLISVLEIVIKEERWPLSYSRQIPDMYRDKYMA